MNKSKNGWTLWAHKKPTEHGFYWIKYYPLPTNGERLEHDLVNVKTVFLDIDKETDIDGYIETLEFVERWDGCSQIEFFQPAPDEVIWFGPINLAFDNDDHKALNRQQLSHFHEHRVTKCDECHDIRKVTSKRAAKYGHLDSCADTKGTCKACGAKWALELVYKDNVPNWLAEQKAIEEEDNRRAEGERLRVIAAKARELEAELLPDPFAPLDREALDEFTRRLDEFKATLK